MTHQTNLLVAWLNDAYAMERSQEEALEHFMKDFGDDPEIQHHLEIDLEETRQEAEDVKECVEKLGGSISKTKTFLGGLSGNLQGLETGPFKDKKVKDMLMLHASNHFEHGSYLALAEGARQLGNEDVANLCDRIAKDEKESAEWAEEQIPAMVQDAMGHKSDAA